jgi:hypothetical protein
VVARSRGLLRSRGQAPPFESAQGANSGPITGSPSGSFRSDNGGVARGGRRWKCLTRVRLSAPLGSVAVDPERFEHPCEWDSRLLADGADIRLVSVEEAEDGLVGGHEDQAKEAELAPLTAQPMSGLPRPARRRRDLLFADVRPVTLDQVALPSAASGHVHDATPPRPKGNRVFPYAW